MKFLGLWQLLKRLNICFHFFILNVNPWAPRALSAVVAAAAPGALSAAERMYPTLEVRGTSREDPMPEGRQPRGVTQRRPRVPGCDSVGTAEKSYPSPRSGEASERRYPVNEVSGGSREELPYARGQGRQPGGPTPCPRSSGCAGGHRRA